MKSTEFLIEYDERIKQTAKELGAEYKLPREYIYYALKIRRDCEQFVSMAHDPMDLYRGIRTNDKFVNSSVKLNGRAPVDMPNTSHDMINDYFNSAFGAPFRNAMFCTGSEVQTEEYGTAYHVFPIGKFEFLWSPDISDLFSEHDMYGEDDTADFMNEVVRSAKWKTTNFNNAMYSGNEIMIRCKSYYGINADELRSIAGRNGAYGMRRIIAL